MSITLASSANVALRASTHSSVSSGSTNVPSRIRSR